MSYKRQNINGTSPQDLKAMNDNFQYLWLKVFGDISMSDVANDVKDMLYTNWLQPQAEGNLDSSNPLIVRFYIPPNTKKIKTANLNLIIDRYKIDSDVATNSDINIRTGTVANASIPVNTTQAKDFSSFTETSGWGGTDKDHWHNFGWVVNDMSEVPPDAEFTERVYQVPMYESAGAVEYIKIKTTKGQGASIQTTKDTTLSGSGHKHRLPDFSHSHTIVIPEHSHELQLVIDGHEHPLNFGIKRADVAPQNVKMYINDVYTEKTFTGDLQTLNEFNIIDYLKIGQWNTIKFTTTNLARVTLYGIVELLQSYR